MVQAKIGRPRARWPAGYPFRVAGLYRAAPPLSRRFLVAKVAGGDRIRADNLILALPSVRADGKLRPSVDDADTGQAPRQGACR